MQMRPEVQIASMIKAMTDVVIPAVAGTNKLAEEQAKLVVGMLHLMAHQLPVQFRFDRDELARLVSAGAALQDLPVADAAVRQAADALAAQCDAAGRLLEQCKRDPAELRTAVATLRDSMCTLVEANAAAGGGAALEVERVVLAMSAEQLLRDRALMKPQGWEADPAALPEIGTLLGS